jgi:hypothetical protein
LLKAKVVDVATWLRELGLERYEAASATMTSTPKSCPK